MLQQTFITLERDELKDLIKETVKEINSSQNKSEVQKDETLLNMKEAAQYLRVSIQTIQKYKREGTIPYFQQGRTILFRKSELIESMRAKK